METVRELMRLAPAPAVAVSVFDRDSVRFSEVHGTADVTTGRPAEMDDWWDLASLTKTLVTLPEVLALCDERRLDLDRPLAEQWPTAANSPAGAATIRNLLSHSAGLPASEKLHLSHTGRTAMVEAALATPLEYRPGTSAAYSDIGYLILGEVLESITGRSLADLASHRTGLRFAPLPGPAVATEMCPWRRCLMVGEAHDENAWAMDGRAGHAGAFGTLAQVTDAARAWFADRVVSGRLHRQARDCWATNVQGERFGLGWWLNPTRNLGGPAAGPDGYGASGFVGNRIWFEPDRGYGVVILSNRVHPHRTDRTPFLEWTWKLFAALA